MKKLPVILAVVTSLWSCSPEKKVSKKTNINISENFNQLLKEYNEGKLVLNPIDATYAGDNRFNNIFPDFLSENYQAKKKDFFTSFKSKLNRGDALNKIQTEIKSSAVKNQIVEFIKASDRGII